MSDSTKYQRYMNNALDRDLSEPEWEALQAHLAESEEDAAQWEQLQDVDEVLSTTPQVDPPPGFAKRVMAAIASLHLGDFASRQLGVGIAFGMMAAAFFILPLLSLLLIALLLIITDPGALNELFQTGTSGASYFISVSNDIGDNMGAIDQARPVLLILASAVIPLALLWAWSVRHVFNKQKVSTNQRASQR
ncbi:MAG: hypothetical protein GYB65_10925 [Chloroflexi bacterium]|nr:hypothetical protein [Chloroflexota bacterium]